MKRLQETGIHSSVCHIHLLDHKRKWILVKRRCEYMNMAVMLFFFFLFFFRRNQVQLHFYLCHTTLPTSVASSRQTLAQYSCLKKMLIHSAADNITEKLFTGCSKPFEKSIKMIIWPLMKARIFFQFFLIKKIKLTFLN